MTLDQPSFDAIGACLQPGGPSIRNTLDLLDGNLDAFRHPGGFVDHGHTHWSEKDVIRELHAEVADWRTHRCGSHWLIPVAGLVAAAVLGAAVALILSRHS